jgi:hypothetical protein
LQQVLIVWYESRRRMELGFVKHPIIILYQLHGRWDAMSLDAVSRDGRLEPSCDKLIVFRMADA